MRRRRDEKRIETPIYILSYQHYLSLRREVNRHHNERKDTEQNEIILTSLVTYPNNCLHCVFLFCAGENDDRFADNMNMNILDEILSIGISRTVNVTLWRPV